MSQIISVHTKWRWNKELEDFFRTQNHGLSLHVCCGLSDVGTVRLDIDHDSKANVIADMFHLPFKREVFDTILCDPPYRMAYDKRLLFLYPLTALLKTGGHLLLKINWIPRLKGMKRLATWLYEGARYWGNLSVIIKYIKIRRTLDQFQFNYT